MPVVLDNSSASFLRFFRNQSLFKSHQFGAIFIVTAPNFNIQLFIQPILVRSLILFAVFIILEKGLLATSIRLARLSMNKRFVQSLILIHLQLIWILAHKRRLIDHCCTVFSLYCRFVKTIVFSLIIQTCFVRGRSTTRQKCMG